MERNRQGTAEMAISDAQVRSPEKGINVASPQIIAPYIVLWSDEEDQPVPLVEREGIGLGYADELGTDRDKQGVLWLRTTSRPGSGRPVFGEVHSLRQRRAMRRLLCQVCAGPADQTGDGVLWLLKDHRKDWDGWPENMGVTEPPVCLPCARLSVSLCPALRRGAVAVRARTFPVAGVQGVVYRGGAKPTPVKHDLVAFDDPAIRWVRAMHLVRELHGCTFVPLHAD
jgi:hypothetical protein